jgi:hypothetical protein
MAKIVKHRRGTTAELSGVVGDVGEIFIDTIKRTVVVMDPTIPGGVPLATEAAIASGATTTSLGTVRVDGTSVLVTAGLISVNTTFGTSLAIFGGYQPDTTGNTVELIQFSLAHQALSLNTSYLRIYSQRNSTSADTTQASFKIQQRSLDPGQPTYRNAGYIEFNPQVTPFAPAGLALGVGDYQAIRMDQYGRMTTQTQPAFVNFPQGVSVNYTAGNKILYEGTNTLNRGNHYDRPLSRFTAPVTGLYLFKAHAWVENGLAGSIRFAVNGTQVYGRIGPENSPSLGLFGMNLIEQIYLSANDYVEVFCSIGTIRVDRDYSTFSGILIG